jgi:murein DD-endopeptidase MepM/ murein hydrolase activator NlpD
VRAQREEAGEELDVLEGESAALEARIRAVQSAPSTGSGSSTVTGVVTSGYGWRWGRLHEGIDIAAPIATPVRAAASGTVIYAGVMSGYGNIIVIDHGGGLSTAYAHLSAIYAGGGGVSQGQTIGSVGSTGHSTGPHLHFEVRVNGTAVDPLGYL